MIIKRDIKSAMYDTLFFYHFRISECGAVFFRLFCFQSVALQKITRIFEQNMMHFQLMFWNFRSYCCQTVIKTNLARSSRWEVFCKKGAFKNFAKFTGKHLCQCLFLNKVANLRPGNLLKSRLWHRYFPVNFVKF